MRNRLSSFSLYQVRLVSSVTLKTVAVRLDAVDAHAGDGDDQVLVLVELHAERPSADMGEDLALLEVRAGEADDVAVAGAAVEPVVPIEDDVLGTLDLVEADGFGVDQAVVLGEGRVAAALAATARSTSGTAAGLT